MKHGSLIKTGLAMLSVVSVLAVAPVSFAADENANTQTLTGEVVDVMCYLDHGAKGEKHQGCASTCIKNGGPVGLLSGDQLYLVVGEHKPMNKELASKAGQTVTLKGKVVERNGVKMIENSQLQ